MSKYKKGNIIEVTVTGLERYGIFVGLEDDYTGLIHISEISNEFVKSVGAYANIGEKIYAKIIEVDEDNRKIKMSIKDIDYKNSRAFRRQKIVETETGFNPLKEKLDEWIEEKLQEIEKN